MIKDKNYFLEQFKKQTLNDMFDFQIYFELYGTIEYSKKRFYLLESISEIKHQSLSKLISKYLFNAIVRKEKDDEVFIFYCIINLLYIQNNHLKSLKNITQTYTKNISIDTIIGILNKIDIQYHMEIFKVLRFGYSRDLEYKIILVFAVKMDSDNNYFNTIVSKLIRDDLGLFLFIHDVIITFLNHPSKSRPYINKYQDNINSFLKKLNNTNLFQTLSYEQSIIIDDIINGFTTPYNQIEFIMNQLIKSDLLTQHFINISYKVYYMNYLKKLNKFNRDLFKIIFNEYSKFIFLHSKDIFFDDKTIVVYLYCSYIARAIKYKMIDQELIDFIKSIPLEEFKKYLKLIQPVSISKHNKKRNMFNPHLKLSIAQVKYFKKDDIKYLLSFFKKYRIEFYDEIIKS